MGDGAGTVVPDHISVPRFWSISLDAVFIVVAFPWWEISPHGFTATLVKERLRRKNAARRMTERRYAILVNDYVLKFLVAEQCVDEDAVGRDENQCRSDRAAGNGPGH
jgi:hypothetical protein